MCQSYEYSGGNIIPVTFTSGLEVMAKPTDALGTPPPIHVCSSDNCDGKDRQIDSVDSEDSEDSEAGSRVSRRQVVQDKTMEDSDDSDSGDSEGSEDSEDSDGDYNTNFTCEGRPYKVRKGIDM